jgi:hypothetical protein
VAEVAAVLDRQELGIEAGELAHRGRIYPTADRTTVRDPWPFASCWQTTTA